MSKSVEEEVSTGKSVDNGERYMNYPSLHSYDTGEEKNTTSLNHLSL